MNKKQLKYTKTKFKIHFPRFFLVNCNEISLKIKSFLYLFYKIIHMPYFVVS